MNVILWALSSVAGAMASFGLVLMQGISEVGFWAKADDTEGLLHRIFCVAQSLF